MESSSDEENLLKYDEKASDTEDIHNKGLHERVLEPYRFETVAASAPVGASGEEWNTATHPEVDERTTSHASSWCICGFCDTMLTSTECLCCREVSRMAEKCEGMNVGCITEHPGFARVCLNPWVLETAYVTYREQNGELTEETQQEKYRLLAYWQLGFWCFRFVEKSNRVVLPSCAVNKIRSTFQSDDYQGFKLPNL